jgi:hypothetical protein
MGRYANFSTGLEYKFAFGIQSSEDMEEFEGVSYNGSDQETLVHKWIKSDEVLIKKKLEEHLIDISMYKNNIEGTNKLKSYLYNIKMDYKYILGYLIYHQLQYVEELSVEYEL